MTDTSPLPDRPAPDRPVTARPGPVRRAWSAFRDLPRPLRVTAWVAVALVLVLVALTAGATAVLRRPLPVTEGEVDVPGLEAEVRVLRDEHGIPQLWGESLHDLALAQGYVHAQERFWEMDVRRHVTAGRLSELFGEDGLETDRVVRTLGWRRVAERELPLLQPRTRAVLDAYADGVNAYLDERGTTELAVEYALLRATGLDYTPEPWTAVDSLAWLKAMAWDLRGNVEEEVQRTLVNAALPADRAAQLFPGYPFDRNAPIVDAVDLPSSGKAADSAGGSDGSATGSDGSAGVDLRAAATAVAPVAEALAAVPALLGRGDGVGSNSWVVSGEHTATGEPLLANDPHLGTSLPGIWVQMGLHCVEVTDDCPLDVSGFTFSGVPGVVIGHNSDVAWGFTNLGPDVTDLYLERVVGDRWLHDGRLRPLRTRTEVIEVRDAPDVELEVRETAHGPIVSGVLDDVAEAGALAQADPPPPGPAGGEVDPARDEGYDVSLAWTALRPGRTADAILGLNTATDWESFREAARDFAVPSQNLVYADRAGNVGYQAPGLIPVRGPGSDGRVPAEGWDAANDWQGFVPFEELPSVLDPQAGFVVTANQAVAPEDFPVRFTADWDQGYRAQRIRDLVEQGVAEGGVTVADMAAWQLDSRHPLASVLVPLLVDVDLPAGHYRKGQRLLPDWDFSQPADGPGSAAAAYVNVVWSRLLALTFHDELPEEAWPDGDDRWVSVVRALLQDPVDPFWDDVTTEGVQETRDDVLRLAQLQAVDELVRLRSRRAVEWEWGRLHTTDLRHQTLGESGIGLLELLLNREGWRTPGGSSAVDAASWDAAEGYTVEAAPSMRMVVDLADLDRSRWINLTGVSGHPASAHYVDQTELWVEGRTLPWPHSREATEEAAEDVLVLRPDPDGDPTGG